MQKVHDSIYLDYASTTPVHPEILKDAQILQSHYFENADSIYEGGQRVQKLITQSREALSAMLGVLPHEIFFTSGASESNNAAIKGIALANAHIGKHIITTKVEHSSVLGACEQLENIFGYHVDYLDVDACGCPDLKQLKQLLRADTVLVAMMAINNEVGAITDISKVAQIVKKGSRALLHIDAVQALGKMDISLQQIDSVSFSAHKIYGMKGSGLWVKKAHVNVVPLINGGQQQEGIRGGTLNNVPVILWAKTLRLAREAHKHKIHDIIRMRDYLYATFEALDGVRINSTKDGSPYIFNVSFDQVGSEIMMNGLNRKGIFVSAQSTCNSKSLKPSHVLKAMGCDDECAMSCIRISLSHLTTHKEIEKTCQAIMEIKNYVQSNL